MYHISKLINRWLDSGFHFCMSIQRFKILLYTPFKVGSNSLSQILHTNYDFFEVWPNAGKRKIKAIYNRQRRCILRGHTLPLDSIFDDSGLTFDCWITIIRKPYEIYPSCYFQDITNPEYPYYLGSEKKVQETSIEKLINHFLTFDWCHLEQTDYHYNFSQILKYTGLDLWQESFDKSKGFQVYPSKKTNIKRIGVIRFDKLNDRYTLLEFFREMRILSNRNSIIVRKNNLSQDKFYYEIISLIVVEITSIILRRLSS